MESLGVVFFFILGFISLQSVESLKYQPVGDENGWTLDVNYTLWSAYRHFYVGQELVFVTDKNHYDVLEVNEDAYNLCDDRLIITNVSASEGVAFKLTQVKSYYFISRRDLCLKGLKLAVNAVFPPPPPPGYVFSSSAAARGLPLFLVVMVVTWWW